jgi:antitoxin component YwqK of YwqJK toxin-antitoxin module
MIRILATALLALCLTASGAFALSTDDLVPVDGLWYKKFTDVPFTGKLDEGLERGAFKNGKREGPWSRYYEDGRLWYKGEYKNNKLEGPYIRYWSNGRPYRKGEYKNNKLEGPYVSYWPSGRPQFKGEYKNGKREGPWVGYWDNDWVWFEGAYKSGKREGPWDDYNTDGTKDEDGSGTYRNGEKVSD